jgi:hypothetical protein
MLRDQTQLTFEQPVIQADTLYGWDEKRVQRRRVALGNVEHVAIRQPDAGKTVMAVLGAAAAGALIFLGAVLTTVQE